MSDMLLDQNRTQVRNHAAALTRGEVALDQSLVTFICRIVEAKMARQIKPSLARIDAAVKCIEAAAKKVEQVANTSIVDHSEYINKSTQEICTRISEFHFAPLHRILITQQLLSKRRPTVLLPPC